MTTRSPFQMGLGSLLMIVALAGLGARMDWPFTISWLAILGVVILVRELAIEARRRSPSRLDSADDDPTSI